MLPSPRPSPEDGRDSVKARPPTKPGNKGVSILFSAPTPTDPPPEPQKPPKPTQNEPQQARDPPKPPQSPFRLTRRTKFHQKRPSFDPFRATLKFGKVRNLPRDFRLAFPPGRKSRNSFLCNESTPGRTQCKNLCFEMKVVVC